MYRILITLLFFMILHCYGCILNKKGSGQVFEYKNDTVIQRVEIIRMHDDTLEVSLKISNLRRKISCFLEGKAIRDTTGDFLNEEETVRDEKGEVFSITNYRFFNNGTTNLLNIQIDRIDKNKLIYYEVDSIWASENPNCLLSSIGALRKQ